ncbi:MULTISPECIES: SGNH/GDSL hydrolase family protein [unclassified Bradyrhizobium]|uniref:SGNH/GDSL hydrolase family protein n=1 Tax=unclassified Bradyrhizobium TaxID=2631580 RepID=UPI0028E48198|nr:MULTISPECIES: SGNH/GDSL hydrolase family protein [unclassified Bradyrhizobium]
MTDAPIRNPDLDPVRFEHPLKHLSESLKRRRKTRIVALGSSSTAGANGILAFPARLEWLLRQNNYGRMIDVVNRGIGGQEAPEELSRFECDVLAEQPALVIWQVGTNAVYRSISYNPAAVEAAIAVGLDLLAEQPVDVVVMDLQYTAALVNLAEKLAIAEDIEQRIEKVCAAAKVNLFKRWALMKRWCTEAQIPLAAMDDGGDDHLHMSEWATAYTTAALGRSIMSAVNPEV